MCIILIDSRNKIKIVVQKSGHLYFVFPKFNVAESHDQKLITHLSRINHFVFIYSLVKFFKEINKK